MDLMIGRSLQQTIAARGLPVMTYSVNTDEDNFIVYLERSANKWPLMPENFAFFIMHDGAPEFYRLKRDFINLGGDYTLYDQHDKIVGHLDGKVFSIGGKWKGKVKREHADRRLLTVLQLFSAMQIFNSDCRRHMRRLWKDAARRKGQAAARAPGSRPLHEPAPHPIIRKRILNQRSSPYRERRYPQSALPETVMYRVIVTLLLLCAAVELSGCTGSLRLGSSVHPSTVRLAS